MLNGVEPFHLPSNGAYPWAGADYGYAGWVPNVSGHLSFNLIDPHSREPTYNHQPDLSLPRTVALRRLRLAQDYPFPDRLVKRLRKSATQEFVVLAESSRVPTPYFEDDRLEEADDANGLLMGIVAVLPHEGDKQTCRKRKQLLGHIDSHILAEADAKVAGAVNPQRRLASEILDHLRSERDHIACYFLRFALFRTGELRIWFSLEDFYGRDFTTVPATPLELQAAEHLAPQVYYCLKDLLHAHYHHDPHSDQLLPLIRTDQPSGSGGQAGREMEWRYATLRGLARVVIELRHGRSANGHQRAKGIIAYAQAFQALLARCRRPTQIGSKHAKEDRLIPYDFSNLIMSLDAVDTLTQSGVSARLQLFGIVIGIILSGLALWSGAVQIQPILCTSLASPDVCPKIGSGPIVNLVTKIVANPSAFMILLVTVGIGMFMVFFNGSNALPWVERGIRWLRRLSEAIGTQVSRWLKGSDWIGWLMSLTLLGSLTLGLAYVAYKLAPKTKVPPVTLDGNEGSNGPWSTLYPLVGQHMDQSGLLVRSAIAPDLRSLLGDHYAAYLKLMGQDATLVREGQLLAVTSTSPPGGDGAYLIIDPKALRLEAGLRNDGLPIVRRSVGPNLRRPAVVTNFLGAASASDGGPIAIEQSICDFTSGGTAGRTLQLSGTLRAKEYCEYAIDLHAGQGIAFDRAKARGLEVQTVMGKITHSIGPTFVADHSGPQVIHVIWSDWHPTGAAALRPRPFYVRLTVH